MANTLAYFTARSKTEKKVNNIDLQMWHVLQSEVTEKNDSNKLSVERSRDEHYKTILALR